MKKPTLYEKIQMRNVSAGQDKRRYRQVRDRIEEIVESLIAHLRDARGAESYPLRRVALFGWLSLANDATRPL